MNLFLDSLCNLGFKNIGQTPGIPKECFQHPQDIVKIIIWQSSDSHLTISHHETQPVSSDSSKTVDINFNVISLFSSASRLKGFQSCLMFITVQVNLFQKHLFLHQLTHKMKKRLFIELQVQYMKTTSSEHVVTTNCFVFVLTFRTIYVPNMFWACSFHVLNS